MRKIIYTMLDGRMAVVHPVRNTRGETLTTDEEIEKRAWAALPADARNPRWALEAEVPADRTFRDAWKDGGDRITHDMEKCRKIHRDRLRAERAPLFVKNDLSLRDAMLSGDEEAKAAALAKRDALRDAPADPAIDAAKTPEELKEALPTVLRPGT